MKLPTWFDLKFKDILILLAIFGLFLRGEFKKPPEARIETKTTVKEFHHRDTITKVPIITQQTIEKNIPIQYIPSENKDTLRKQYDNILAEHTVKNIYSDTTKIDTIGSIVVLDTIQYNRIMGRKIFFDIKEKVITNTITIREPYKPKNQFFIGGGVGATTQGSVEQLNLGLMFKNKKDRMIGVAAGYNFVQSSPQINLNYYQKIKF